MGLLFRTFSMRIALSQKLPRARSVSMASLAVKARSVLSPVCDITVGKARQFENFMLISITACDLYCIEETRFNEFTLKVRLKNIFDLQLCPLIFLIITIMLISSDNNNDIIITIEMIQ